MKKVYVWLIAVLLGFQTVYGQDGRISRGDILEIVVYNRAELSKTVTVRDDGTVDYPFVTGIPIDALTIDEFRELLISQVMKYTGEAPIITVQYSRRLTIPVVVLGQVKLPGEIVVPQHATLQGALTLAGGPTSQAELNRVKIIRGDKDPKDTLIVDLYAFSIKGDPGLLPPLKENDIIFVPGIPGISDVKVIGAVKSPGNLTVPPGTSLLDVLFLAGGPAPECNMNHIRLYDTREKQEIRVYLADLIKENRFDEIPSVDPGDVIVAEAKPRFWKQFFEGFRTVASVAYPVILILIYTGVIERH